ncbi:tail fiber domain-containing protein [Klebsiella variicola]
MAASEKNATDSENNAKASETAAAASAGKAETAAAGVENPVSYAKQSLTAGQQQQAITNLGLDSRYLPAFPVSSQDEGAHYTRVVTIKMTGTNQANVTLLLSGANNFGENINQTDIVSLSCRGSTPAIRHLILSDVGVAANRATWGYVLSADKSAADFYLIRPSYSGAFHLSTLSTLPNATLYTDAPTTTEKPDGLVVSAPVFVWSDAHKPAASDVDAVPASKGGEFGGMVTATPVFRARKVYSGSGATGELAVSGALQMMLEGRGGNGTPEGAIVNLYLEEQIGSEHRCVLYVGGFSQVRTWMFRSAGQTTSPLGDLQVNGSDIRLKRDFTPVAGGYRERIEKIGVVEFNYRDDKDTDKRKRGFLAQQMGDIDDIYAFFAGHNTDDNGEAFDILNVNHTAVMADLVATVQDFLGKVDGLKQQVAALTKADVGS